MLTDFINLIKSKLNNNSATVHYTGPKTLRDGNTFIFAKSADDWTVYQGCDLIVGDTTLEYCAQCVLDLIDLS